MEAPTAPYNGPSVHEMITTHTLASNIMSRHSDPCPILSPSELHLLRRFVTDPTAHHQILHDCGMLDPPPTGEHPRHGSLIGYVIAKHGEAAAASHSDVQPAMSDREIQDLKTWFASGVPDARLVGACETGRGWKEADGVWRL